MASSNSISGPVHVEVCQKMRSSARAEALEEHVRRELLLHPALYGEQQITQFADPALTEHVESITVVDLPMAVQSIDTASQERAGRFIIHVFQLNMEEAAEEMDDTDDDEITAAQQWILPSGEFHGLWESLVYDEDIKSQLLNYATTTMLFSDRKVDSTIIAWNRVILLHGPPGTGKTSLCKALAQKLSVRLSKRFSRGQLVEINSHSLFSRWFSESGKLVMRMFKKIQELVADPSAFVCVLIDEVESLTAARQAAISGTEPSDAIRVVNAVLTQIDAIKRFPNVMILTTSNITGAIDLAFVDRADIKQYIGPPSVSARYSILCSCIGELTRVGIITSHEPLIDVKTLKLMRFVSSDSTRPSLMLYEIAKKCEGFSGRTLRKLPFLAHALFIQTCDCLGFEDYLQALSQAVDAEIQQRSNLLQSSSAGGKVLAAKDLVA
eukprot:m.74823 g.74823  ORF g.74823 m.74823 type:complete len:439 (+) comp14538_c0_seq1:165-1481(+)